MKEKKEEIIGTSCLVVFDILNRMSWVNRQILGTEASDAIEKALAVIPRLDGEILSRIDSSATSIIVDALIKTEASLNNAYEIIDASLEEYEIDTEDEEDEIRPIRDEKEIGRLIYLERLLKECQRALKATGRRLIEKKSFRIWVPLDIWIIAVDETECWQLENEDIDKCERIEGIYLFDKNETIKCGDKSCYFLWGINNRPVFKKEVSDNDKNRIRKLVAKTGEIANHHSQIIIINENIKIIQDDESRCYHFGNPNFDLALDYEYDENSDKKTEIINILCNWCRQINILN